VSALIQGLKEKHRELEEAKKNYTSEDLRLREERRRTDLKELRLRQKELELRSGSVSALHRLLSESRKTLENLVRELKEGEINREKTLSVKEYLAELEKTVLEQDRLLEQEERDFYTEQERHEEPKTDRPLPAETLEAGVEVLVKTLKRRGVILRRDKKDTWVVEVGSVKMSFPEKDLSPVAPVRQKAAPLVAQLDLVSQTPAQLELNLRGLRLEEALEVLQKQIDAATLSGLYEFSVIHGKGDGILQKGVHGYLKNQSQVERFSFSPPEQGGFGKTLVSLKR
jgi:DNA mismatch repair protein MutS2